MGVRIVWDPPKRRFNLKSHGLDFGVVTLEFLADAVIRPAKKGRLQAIGLIDGRAVSLIFSAAERGHIAHQPPGREREGKGVAVMEREDDEEDDIRDVLDNPEWSEADIWAGRTLADFEPALAANIGRAIGRPVRSGKRVDTTATPEHRDDAAERALA